MKPEVMLLMTCKEAELLRNAVRQLAMRCDLNWHEFGGTYWQEQKQLCEKMLEKMEKGA